jgi:hypothetical protein
VVKFLVKYTRMGLIPKNLPFGGVG